MKWPSDEQIRHAEKQEEERAERHGDEPDPICDCGMPGYACYCEEIASDTGEWRDGTPHEQD